MTNPDTGYTIRRATPDDAEPISRILSLIAAEAVHSAIDRPWPADAQRRYLESLSPREAFHVAIADGSQEVIGYQSLDLWSPILNTMSHVAQIGTFLDPAWRRHGVGRALFAASVAHARSHAFRKFVITVRASNLGAQRFYTSLGFSQCGRLTRQVTIAGLDDDEILFEYFL